MTYSTDTVRPFEAWQGMVAGVVMRVVVQDHDMFVEEAYFNRMRQTNWRDVQDSSIVAAALIEMIKEQIEEGKTVSWNGQVGAYAVTISLATPCQIKLKKDDDSDTMHDLEAFAFLQPILTQLILTEYALSLGHELRQNTFAFAAPSI